MGSASHVLFSNGLEENARRNLRATIISMLFISAMRWLSGNYFTRNNVQ